MKESTCHLKSGSTAIAEFILAIISAGEAMFRCSCEDHLVQLVGGQLLRQVMLQMPSFVISIASMS
jgi:hypothetical protein